MGEAFCMRTLCTSAARACWFFSVQLATLFLEGYSFREKQERTHLLSTSVFTDLDSRLIRDRPRGSDCFLTFFSARS